MTYDQVISVHQLLHSTTDPMARITHFRDCEAVKRCSLYPFDNDMSKYVSKFHRRQWHLTCCRMKAGIGLSFADYNALSEGT